MEENVDLPDRTLEVLVTADQFTNDTMVSTLRESFHWAEKNQHIHYRVNQLEDAGLVTTYKDEDARRHGPLAPRKVRVTEDGEEIADEFDENVPDGLEERMERVEKQLKQMKHTYGDVKQRMVEMEGEVDDMDSKMAEARLLLKRAIEALGEVDPATAEAIVAESEELQFDEGEMQFGD